jgi:hypothetical protein
VSPRQPILAAPAPRPKAAGPWAIVAAGVTLLSLILAGWLLLATVPWALYHRAWVPIP